MSGAVLLQPPELHGTRPMHLHGGAMATTTQVWQMLTASWRGDLDAVRALVRSSPALLTCQYDYTAPLHLAVREGHLELVRYLVDEGALDPGYRTHPFLDPLVTFAADRGYLAIAEVLVTALADPARVHPWGDTGGIERNQSEARRLIQELITQGRHEAVAAMLRDDPALALDQDAFWGEGILCVPAKAGDHRMLELLMESGARVPDLSKWGARYYFHHEETAAWLLARGMHPGHMNWRRFTLLHDMAFTGEVRKAELLLDAGAEIDAIDDEYLSTPLGYAAHWGQLEVARTLLARGADPDRSGAPWSTPLAWARRKNQPAIVAALLAAGAREM